MAELLKRFFYICLLSRAPQDIPYSNLLLRIVLLLYFFTGILSMLPNTSLEHAIMEMAVDIVVLLLFVWLCLSAFHKLERLYQTITALAGVGALFQFLAWPMLAQLEVARQAEQMLPELSFLLLLLISWNLAVYAHIFRHAFEIRMPVAFVMTLAYAIINITIRQILFV